MARRHRRGRSGAFRERLVFEYRIDDEQRSHIRDCVHDCLTKESIALSRDDFDRLICDIEDSINRLLIDDGAKATFRQNHDKLSALWKRCRLSKPPVRVLREELKKFPGEAIQHLARRARVVIPQICSGDTLGDCVFDPPNRLAALLLEWAAVADDEKLVRVLRVLTNEGGRIISGQSRGGGKRSRVKFGPMLLGEIRGVGSRDHRGGPPIKRADHELVQQLALAWSYNTGHLPKLGRGDHHTGFGDLVHSIFQLLEGIGEGDELQGEVLNELIIDEAAPRQRMKRATADYALRRYSETLEKRKQRAAPIADPLVCADCQWVRPGASREEFYCTKLEIACETARSSGQACGPEGAQFQQVG
jgi:hypothetical protein